LIKKHTPPQEIDLQHPSTQNIFFFRTTSWGLICYTHLDSLYNTELQGIDLQHLPSQEIDSQNKTVQGIDLKHNT